METAKPPERAAGSEALARQALNGDRTALERVVERLQGDVFGLALRMLGIREDGEDAAQEILIHVVTRLAQFDFRSRLETWAYRIAVNAILDFRSTPWEDRSGVRFGAKSPPSVVSLASPVPTATRSACSGELGEEDQDPPESTGDRSGLSPMWR